MSDDYNQDKDSDSFEKDLTPEIPKAKSSSSKKRITLRQAIEYGEYDVTYLSTFPEWHELPKHMQFEYLNEAMDNRRKQLLQHWAYINRTSNWSVRDDLKEISAGIEKQLDELERDRQKIMAEYLK
ncbi:MAG: hypothetical protein N2558_03590 [Patescibacteria group bacterium]|nr:hypothetical protein [Patescibacteria group bacterium]